MPERIIRTPNTPGRVEDGFRVLQGKQEYVTYSEGASFRFWYSDIAWRYETHFHSAVEIVLTRQGKVTYEVGNRRYEVCEDEVLIVPPGMEHGLSMDGDSKRYLILFEPDALYGMGDIKLLSRGFNQVFYLNDHSPTHTKVRDLILQAVQIYQEEELMWNTTCYSLMMQVYAILGQRFLAGMAVIPKRERTRENSQIISSVMTYINNHYRDNLTLDDAAEAAGFSRFYFSRFFKLQTGYSFKEYLCQKRLQVAMELLIHSDTPMGDVALESGFGSVATFNRVFREHKNCTPTQYRAIYGSW